MLLGLWTRMGAMISWLVNLSLNASASLNRIVALDGSDVILVMNLLSSDVVAIHRPVRPQCRENISSKKRKETGEAYSLSD
jgi:hypothetical protein